MSLFKFIISKDFFSNYKGLWNANQGDTKLMLSTPSWIDSLSPESGRGPQESLGLNNSFRLFPFLIVLKTMTIQKQTTIPRGTNSMNHPRADAAAGYT